MTQSLRVATVGCGYFSQFHYDAWNRLPVELVAVANREADMAQVVAERYGIPATAIYREPLMMLENEKPDLLDIITPPQTHLSYIKMAASQGVDVVCQKPFTRSLAEAEQAIAIVQAAGIRLIIHENFRFQPWYREIGRLLECGVLGELYSAQFRLRPGDGQGVEAYLERQPTFQEMPRFLVNETAVHLIDVFRFLFGEVVSVYADLRQLNPAIKGEDAGHVLMHFNSGLQGHFDGNRLADHAADNRRLTMGELRIEGSQGELCLNGDAVITVRRFGENKGEVHAYDWRDHGFGGDCVYQFQKHVVDHLTRGTTLENKAADYLANLRVVEAAYDSQQQGSKVSLKPPV